jgi:hypothetical protein
MVVYLQRMPLRTSRYALGVSSRKSAAKNRTPSTVGPGKIGWKDERHRRSDVERGEQIVLAMLAGVGAGAAGRWHHPVSLQPIERPGDLDDGHVEVLAPAQISAAARYGDVSEAIDRLGEVCGGDPDRRMTAQLAANPSIVVM